MFYPYRFVRTVRKRVWTLLHSWPRPFPSAKNSLCAGILVQAALFLPASIHTITSGIHWWGCSQGGVCVWGGRGYETTESGHFVLTLLHSVCVCVFDQYLNG